MVKKRKEGNENNWKHIISTACLWWWTWSAKLRKHLQRWPCLKMIRNRNCICAVLLKSCEVTQWSCSSAKSPGCGAELSWGEETLAPMASDVLSPLMREIHTTQLLTAMTASSFSRSMYINVSYEPTLGTWVQMARMLPSLNGLALALASRSQYSQSTCFAECFLGHS